MLEILRKGKSSIFGFIIIGFCAALMLPFGLDMINSSGSQSTPIVVDGQEISQRQFHYRQQQIQNIFRNQFKENFPQIRKMLNLPQRTVDDLVNSVLLNNFLEKLNFGAGVSQIETKIASHPYFQGQITQASFQNFLQAQGLNSAALESSTKRQILLDQLQKVFTHVSVPSTKEIENTVKQESLLKKFKYIELKNDNFKDKVKTDNKKELEEYFTKNSDNYLTKKAVSFTAVPFKSTNYLKSVEVDEEELRQIYQSDFSQFYTPAQLKIKQLVINKDRFLTSSEKPNEIELTQSQVTAKEYIENLEKKLNEGTDFLELAAKESDQAITTGWLNRKIIEKEVSSAISNLEPGQISRIIETEKNYKLVLFEDEKERTKKPFESVKNVIENKYRADNAPEYANAEAESLINSDDFVQEAKKLGKEVITTPKAISAGQSTTGISTLAISKIIQMSEGDMDIVSDSSASYLVKIDKVMSPEVPELKTVMEAVKKDFISEKSIELASAKAKELIKKLKNNEGSSNFESIAQNENLVIKSTDFLDKNAQSAPPLGNQKNKFSAFGLSQNNSILITEGSSNYILAFQESKKNENKKIDTKQIASTIQQQNGSRLFEALISYLKSKATIDIDKSILES